MGTGTGTGTRTGEFHRETLPRLPPAPPGELHQEGIGLEFDFYSRSTREGYSFRTWGRITPLNGERARKRYRFRGNCKCGSFCLDLESCCLRFFLRTLRRDIFIMVLRPPALRLYRLRDLSSFLLFFRMLTFYNYLCFKKPTFPKFMAAGLRFAGPWALPPGPGPWPCTKELWGLIATRGP